MCGLYERKYKPKIEFTCTGHCPNMKVYKTIWSIFNFSCHEFAPHPLQKNSTTSISMVLTSFLTRFTSIQPDG